MRELTYILLELERESKKTCDFCSNLYGEDNKSVNQIRTRIKATNKLVDNEVICEECKVKLLNNELPKCERCGRLQNKTYIDILCRCIRNKEDLEEKELPSVPYESQSTFYERQINKLQEEKIQVEVEAQTHLDAMEAFEVYNKKHRQELLDKIDQLEKKNKELEEQNKKLVSEELVQKVASYEKEITELKEQLEQLSKQQATQIETPPKNKGIKNLFNFGGKK